MRRSGLKALSVVGAILAFSLRFAWADHIEDVEGTYNELVEYGFQSPVTRHMLVTPSGKTIELKFKKGRGPRGLRHGAKIRARGHRKHAANAPFDVQADGGDGSQVTVVQQAPAALSATGQQKVLVLLVNFTNVTAQPFTTTYAQDFINGTLNNYYKDASFNQTSMLGTAFGWFDLMIPATCDFSIIRSSGTLKATQAGINLNNYDRVMYVYPTATGCGFAGQAFVGGRDSFIVANYYDLRTVGHEMGHNLGANHSGSFNCGAGTVLNPSLTCTFSEYADPYAVMGSAAPYHFPAQHKEYFGWMSVQSVTASGDYDIAPLESASGTRGLKLVSNKIGDANTGWTYFLEYRQPLGYDAGLSATVTDKLIVHIAKRPFDDRYTYLLDMSPDGNFYDPGLAVGQTFTDPGVGGFTITPLSRTASSMRVRIQFPGGGGDTTAPTVSMTAPAASSIVAGTAVTVSASASDNVGVAGVQFKLDGSNLGAEDTTAPYTVTWNTTQALNGSHILTATARDAAGNATTATGIAVTVDNAAPSVSISAPAAGAFVAGTVNVGASASDNVGVVGVQFKVDGSNLGAEDTSAPYSIPWNTTGVLAGQHALTAVARDAAGNVTTSPSVQVTVDNTAPTISLTSPVHGSTIAGPSSLFADVADNIGVAGVQFKLDGANFGSEVLPSAYPYFIPWDTRTSADGNHTVSAVVRDTAGNAATAIPVQVLVDNTAPVLSGISVAGLGQNGATIVWSTDEPADSVVEYGLTTAYGSDSLETGMTTAHSRPLSGLTPGTLYHYRIKSRDTMGNLTTSADGAFTTITTPDTTPPTVLISSPAGNAVVSGTINVIFTASDDVAIEHVELYRNEAILGYGGQPTQSYTFPWNTNTNPNGPVTLRALAFDSSGNISTHTVVVNVQNDTAPPTVSITAPAPNATVSGAVAVQVSASDNVGVARVELLVDGTLYATDAASPFAFAWNSTSSANGQHILAATAYDAAGNNASQAIAVNVLNDFSAPTISLSAPSAGAVLRGTASVTAAASDDIGVAGVQFKLDGANLGAEDTSAPYSIVWNTALSTEGAHTLTAMARDASGKTRTSASVQVTIDNLAPVLSGISGSGVGTSSAVVQWTTNEAADSQVDYGLTSTYTNTLIHPNYATGHNLTLSGLATNTLYHYRIVSRDAAGNVATTGDRTFTTFGIGDTAAPTVALTSPSSGAVVTGTVTLAANASDNVGVAGVQFKLNGTILGVEDSSAPYSLSWNSALWSNGRYTLSATARDAAGNSASHSISIDVLNDLANPTVAVNLASGTTLSGTVLVKVTASDDVRVARVELYCDGNLLGSLTASPFDFTWNTTLIANGPHTLLAKAYDGSGKSASHSVLVTVRNADITGPTVAIGSPSDGARFKLGTLNVQVSGADADGVRGVELWVDGLRVAAREFSAPVAQFNTGFSWLPRSLGIHRLEARAYDAAGNMGTSQAVRVEILRGAGQMKGSVALIDRAQLGASAAPMLLAAGDGAVDAPEPRALVLSASAGGNKALLFDADIREAQVVTLRGEALTTVTRQGEPILLSLDGALSPSRLESGMLLIITRPDEGKPKAVPLVVVR